MKSVSMASDQLLAVVRGAGGLACCLLLSSGINASGSEGTAPALPASTESIVQTSLPAIVAIRAQTPEGIKSASGFIIDPSGIVATNLHVIQGATAVAVKLQSGETFDVVEVTAYDDKRDLALLRFPGYRQHTLPLGDSETVEQGEAVIAIGHPSGLENSVTDGIVSSIRVLDSGIKVIQTTAPASPGNSGGPLLNSRGEVIGVMSFKISGENLNFAIPSNYVQGLLTVDKHLSFSELSTVLTGATDLFNLPDTSTITGNWKSLMSGNTFILREDGDFIYAERKTTTQDKFRSLWELKKQADDTYAGTSRLSWTCQYGGPFAGFKDKYCNVESDAIFLTVSTGRIEGKVLDWDVPPRGTSAYKRWCKTCGKSTETYWQDFVWIKMQ